MSGTEIIFEVSEDELDGGYSASAFGFGIHTEGDAIEDLRRNVREAAARRERRCPCGGASPAGLREDAPARLACTRHDAARRRAP